MYLYGEEPLVEATLQLVSVKPFPTLTLTHSHDHAHIFISDTLCSNNNKNNIDDINS